MNMKDALLAAAQNDHTEVVRCLIQRDSFLGAQIVMDLTTSESSYADLSVLSSIFEVGSLCFKNNCKKYRLFVMSELLVS